MKSGVCAHCAKQLDRRRVMSSGKGLTRVVMLVHNKLHHAQIILEPGASKIVIISEQTAKLCYKLVASFFSWTRSTSRPIEL